jgi:SAM-dependent methyltransferase
MRAYAESFGSNAARYDRARPRYPEALVRRIADGSPGPDVLDVGCGTGIAARQFQAIGCRVLGVEPDPRMAGVARDLGVEVEVARFEEWEPAGRQFDAVVAGQSWHWIDPVAGAVRARQALRGAGRLAAFWHVFHFPEGVAEAFAEVFGRVVPDSPITITAMTKAAAGGYEAQLDRASDGFKEAGGFGEPERWQYDWEWTHTRDTWLDMMPTMGMLNSLPDEKVAEILDGVGAAVDALGGRFTLPYETVAVIATRTP